MTAGPGPKAGSALDWDAGQRSPDLVRRYLWRRRRPARRAQTGDRRRQSDGALAACAGREFLAAGAGLLRPDATQHIECAAASSSTPMIWRCSTISCWAAGTASSGAPASGSSQYQHHQPHRRRQLPAVRAGRTHPQSRQTSLPRTAFRWADTVQLTIGLKLENDPYSGVSPMPSGRLSWQVVAPICSGRRFRARCARPHPSIPMWWKSWGPSPS